MTYVSGRTVSSEMFGFSQNESTKKVMFEDLECIIKTNKSNLSQVLCLKTKEVKNINISLVMKSEKSIAAN